VLINLPIDTNPVEFWITAAVMLAAAAAVGFIAWLERRPRRRLMPSLIPTTPVLLVFGFIGLLALVHLLNLYGIHTGRPNGP
jgi:amino acid transporter